MLSSDKIDCEKFDYETFAQDTLEANELMLYHYMTHDIALLNVDLQNNSISFVRRNKLDTKMEKTLCDYIKNNSKCHLLASFLDYDDNLVLGVNSEKYQTLAEKQKERKEKIEKSLEADPLVKLILSENDGSYIREIKLLTNKNS